MPNTTEQFRILKLPRNNQGRDFAVGDIHGCYDLLMDALEEVGFDFDKDRLIAVGDLIDRGPDSLKCLELTQKPWFFSTRGNHEEMMEISLFEPNSAARDSAIEMWLRNGGDWVVGKNVREIAEVAEKALLKMPYAIETFVGGKKIGFVHAEVPGDNWSLIERAQPFRTEQMLWSFTRCNKKLAHPIRGIDLVIVGHASMKSPTRLGNVLYIDSGVNHSQQFFLINLNELVAKTYGKKEVAI